MRSCASPGKHDRTDTQGKLHVCPQREVDCNLVYSGVALHGAMGPLDAAEASFDVEDNRVVGLDQIVGDIGEVGMPLERRSLRLLDLEEDELLGLPRGRSNAERQCSRYSRPDRPHRLAQLVAGTERYSSASAAIRLASTANPSPPTRPSRRHRSTNRREQMPQDITLAEPPCRLSELGGVVRHLAVEP